MFRTPPYGPVQEAGGNVGNAKATGADGVKVRVCLCMRQFVGRIIIRRKGLTYQEIHGTMMK